MPPILSWSEVRRATYYHVQLFRGQKRILAVWPVRPELSLRPAWAYAGARHGLRPGRYRWYVWAGIGPRSARRFQKLGQNEFVVVRTAP